HVCPPSPSDPTPRRAPPENPGTRRPTRSGPRRRRDEPDRGAKTWARSVLRERVVRKAIEPALAGFGRGHDGMTARPRVLARVAVGRIVAAVRVAALLARPQVHPVRANLHAVVAFPPLRVLDGGNRRDVPARRFS